MRGSSVNVMRLHNREDSRQAHFGCPAEDLCRLFISTLSGAVRRANWKRLLEALHGYTVQYSEGELPFTLEQVALRKVSNEEKVATQGVVAEKNLRSL
ncbi:hypothetical protein OESDEN_10619 [Oesophagostomum dentatum]|uniref:Uncharacterized protein n=1 Tax=Oesophagostomum dentatum TaxID=61180 RepID=A0A0B1SX68_OESDE|nr:hypothetical protein OESDEN_10619 [Oesophagostomum dentatum]